MARDPRNLSEQYLSMLGGSSDPFGIRSRQARMARLAGHLSGRSFRMSDDLTRAIRTFAGMNDVRPRLDAFRLGTAAGRYFDGRGFVFGQAWSEAARSNVFGMADELRESMGRWVEQMHERFRSEFPSNWQELSLDEVEDAGDLMVRTGWSLAWSPPADVVRAVLAAPDDQARKALLVAERASILDDLDQLLAERAGRPEVAGVRDAAVEAVGSYRDGHYRAAQSLAGAALTTATHEHTQQRTFPGVRRALGEWDPENVPFRLYRAALVLAATNRTFVGYNPSKPPRNFNRMATAHDLVEPQFSEANALTGLMLLVSFAVEMSGLYGLRVPADEEDAEDNLGEAA